MPQPLEELWPPFALTITCGPITLSPVRDADLAELDALVHSGVHSPAEMPFFFPWTTGTPGEVQKRLLQYHWAQRAAMSPADWTLENTVRFEGEAVGCQSISTKDYVETRTGETGSWLGMKHQGRGIGTLMRQTICAFMFDHLNAAEVTSAAFLDNPASLAVSRKVGYRENGVVRLKRGNGEVALSQNLVLTAATLHRPEAPIEVEGVTAFRSFVDITA